MDRDANSSTSDGSLSEYKKRYKLSANLLTDKLMKRHIRQQSKNRHGYIWKKPFESYCLNRILKRPAPFVARDDRQRGDLSSLAMTQPLTNQIPFREIRTTKKPSVKAPYCPVPMFTNDYLVKLPYYKLHKYYEQLPEL